MKKVIVLTHGKFAEGILDSLRMITGGTEIDVLCIDEDETMEEVQSNLDKILSTHSEDDQRIIITDIPGGSSTTLAFKYVNQGIHVITGLNLPLLLEIVLGQFDDYKEGINRAIESAKNSIIYLNDFKEKMEEKL